jgi:hypothetical protein
MIERAAFVDADVVKLRYGQIGHEGPVGAAVEAFVDAAVAADPIVPRVLRVDPNGMIVDVAPLLPELPQLLAAIVAHLHEDAHDVDACGVRGIDNDAGKVHGPLIEVIAAFPGFAQVRRAEDAAFLVDRFDAGVDDVRIRRGNRQGDPPQVLAGQAGLQLLPGAAAVRRFVDGTLRSAIDQGPNMPATLVGGSNEHVRVARIEHHVGDAGILTDRQHLLPIFPAVDRLEEATIAAGVPQGPLGGDVNHVGVARVDEDSADMLGVFQTDVLPRLAGVVGAIEAIAITDAALAVVFAGADPDDLRIPGVQRDGADRIRSFIVEDRSPGRTGIGRLPHSARSHCDIICACVPGMHGECSDATRGDGRPD